MLRIGRPVPLLVAIALSEVVTFAVSSAQVPPASHRCERLFGIVHKVTLDEQGRIARMDVDGISASSEAVASPAEAYRIAHELPPSYLAAARRLLERRDYRGEQSPFWTYTLYDPTQPDNAEPCHRGNPTSAASPEPGRYE
jgi:hypothetical protein